MERERRLACPYSWELGSTLDDSLPHNFHNSQVVCPFMKRDRKQLRGGWWCYGMWFHVTFKPEPGVYVDVTVPETSIGFFFTKRNRSPTVTKCFSCQQFFCHNHIFKVARKKARILKHHIGRAYKMFGRFGVIQPVWSQVLIQQISSCQCYVGCSSCVLHYVSFKSSCTLPGLYLLCLWRQLHVCQSWDISSVVSS